MTLRRSLLPLAFLAGLPLVLGCPPEEIEDTAPDADTDTDTDTDTDSDTDADADTDADVDTPTWEGQILYRTTLDGAAECDAVIDLLGSPYTGDCFHCDYAYDIEATLVKDNSTAACSGLSPIYTFLEDQAAWFKAPVLMYWKDFYDYGILIDFLVVGFSVDYTSYGGSYYPGPYIAYLAYDGSLYYGEADFDYPAILWTFDYSTYLYDYSGGYYNNCGTMSASTASANMYGKHTGAGQLDTVTGRLDVWTFTVPKGATDPVYVSVDTTDATTACDMAALLNDGAGCTVQYADDNFECTYTAPYPCPGFGVSSPEAGTYQVVVYYTGYGAGADMADYAISVNSTFDPNLSLLADDVTMYPISGEWNLDVSGQGQPIEN